MAIRRLPGPPAILTPLPTGLTLYTVTLTAVPSRASDHPLPHRPTAGPILAEAHRPLDCLRQIGGGE
jgi:hypothetical protein